MADNRMNEDIKSLQVRLIDDDGTQLGIVNTRDALRMAYDKNMDLIEVGKDSNPPVAKIADWGKIQFQQKKKLKEAKSNQIHNEMKEIQLRPVTDKHDVDIKLKHAKEFIEDGKKVRFLMKFKGRENTHTEIGMKLMLQVKEMIAEVGTIEKEPLLSGNTILMVAAPDQKKKKLKDKEIQNG